MKTLREVAVGSSCTVKKLHGEGAVKRRIMDMGITKGVEIKVQKVAPLGWVDGAFGMLAEDEIGNSMLAAFGNGIAWIFAPLGWGNWQAAVASITGLIAKENIVGTMGVLYGGGELSTWATLAQVFTSVTGFSFLVFNLLCAPCFAAMGAIKREMNSAKWTFFAIAYQCGFAYVIALCINRIGGAFTGSLNIIGLIVSVLLIAGMLFMLFKPYKEANKLTKKVKVK